MKTLKKLLCFALIAMMSLSLVACGSKGSTAAGKVINVMLSTNVMSLDTNFATDGESFEVIADCIDGLTQMDADGAAIPAVASSWDVSDDGLVWTFHIREDANWSNGTPVTANDFVFGWKLGAATNVEYNYMFTSDVACIHGADEVCYEGGDPELLGIKAVDAKTFEVTLDTPVSFFDSLMYFPTFYPINEEFYNSCAAGTYGTSPKTFLSNGAFILSDYIPGTASISLVKNENYYDAAKVTLDGINYQVIGSSDDALSSFKNGSLDVVTVDGDQVDAVKADAAIASNAETTGAGYMWYVSFSQTVNPSSEGYLANANMRLAISNAIDREALVDNFVKDGSLATYTAVPPQFAASSTTGEDFSGDQTKFAEYCGYDVEKAQAYWEAAKAELGIDSATITVIYGNNEGAGVAAVAQALQAQLEENLAGLTVELSPMTKAERLEKMQNDDYEVALTRWGPDYADPMTYLGMWVTNNANNYGFWSNADYDALIKFVTSGADYDERWQAMYDAEELVLKEAVIAPLFTKANTNLIKTGIKGIDFHPVALNRVYKSVTIAE